MGSTPHGQEVDHHATRRGGADRLIFSLLKLFSDTRFIALDGQMIFNPQRPTVLVVSHDASITGAPVLAFNLCQQLSETNNVIALLVKGGPLSEDFQQYTTRVLQVSEGHLDKNPFRRKIGLKRPLTAILSASQERSTTTGSDRLSPSLKHSGGQQQRGPIQALLQAVGLSKINWTLGMNLRSRLKRKLVWTERLDNMLMLTLLADELKQAGGQRLPLYALMNTLTVATWIGSIRELGIAPITLIHEFSAYTRPIGLINVVGLLSSELVFSTELTRRDIAEHHPLLLERRMHDLPQGRCTLPGRLTSQQHGQAMLDPRAWHFLRTLAPETILVIGAGTVQLRKGVDLFIAVADQMRTYCPNQALQFVWIGSGYDPINDFHLGLWLKDQIERSGLEGQLHIFDQSPAYAALQQRANIFLLPSRLDPLPNVAIDALTQGRLVLCFEKATGISDLLMSDQALGEACVAPYLNVDGMARRAAALVKDPERCSQLSNKAAQLAEAWFNMPQYVRTLQDIGEHAATELRESRSELDRLIKFNAIDWNYNPWDPLLSTRARTYHYLLSWRNWSTPRKPFCGFHPGIYKREQMRGQESADPLLHYLEAGRPAGPWSPALITPRQEFSPVDAKVSVALHIHSHYPELLGPLIDAVASNQLRPDLFITTSNHGDASDLRDQVERHGMKITELMIVPNRGRDIGPLMTELGRHFDQTYCFYGHLHSKKSVLADEAVVKTWRDFLVANLIGDAETRMADRIVAAMHAQPRLGLVFPDDPHCIGWGRNRDQARLLGARLGLTTLPEAFDFPIGTMFWARQGALMPLYALGLQWDDYPSEPIGLDGTLLHAIERMIPLVSHQQGYGYALTHVPGVNR